MAITIKMAIAACGTTSNPSKMPGKGTSTPAAKCITGTKLRAVPGSVCEDCYAHERGAYAWTLDTHTRIPHGYRLRWRYS